LATISKELNLNISYKEEGKRKYYKKNQLYNNIRNYLSKSNLDKNKN